MRITRQMDVDQLAERISGDASRNLARRLRKLLCDEHYDRDTDEIDELEWHRLVAYAYIDEAERHDDALDDAR